MHKKTAFSNLVGTGGFVQIIENKKIKIKIKNMRGGMGWDVREMTQNEAY